MSKYSEERLESKIKETVGLLIVQREIKSPGLSSLVSVTRVELANDNSSCLVYISGPLERNALEGSKNALEKSRAFIQKKVASLIKTKYTPRLSFVIDEEGEKSDKLDEIFKKIEEESKG